MFLVLTFELPKLQVHKLREVTRKLIHFLSSPRQYSKERQKLNREATWDQLEIVSLQKSQGEMPKNPNRMKGIPQPRNPHGWPTSQF